MRILFDNGTPRGLARFLVGHSVEEARDHGWEELANGRLMDAAEKAGFDVLLTNDKNILDQQNLSKRKIAVVALQNSQWPMVKLVGPTIAAAVDAATPGTYTEVPVPFKERLR
jgi:predicted nuclease of predicted toxin-antitoxin system